MHQPYPCLSASSQEEEAAKVVAVAVGQAPVAHHHPPVPVSPRMLAMAVAVPACRRLLVTLALAATNQQQPRQRLKGLKGWQAS